MKLPIIKTTGAITLLAVGLTTSPVMAFECTNAGAGTSAPSDSEVANRLACGNNAIASGPSGTAVGGQTDASGDDSTALGRGATASGGNSTALGRSAIASGQESTALGRGATASTGQSIAVGTDANADSQFSTVIGHETHGVFRSTVVGSLAEASTSGVALGYHADALSFGSIAIGYFAEVENAALVDGGGGNIAIGGLSDVRGAETINATAIGVRAEAVQSNTMILGSIPGVNSGDNFVDVGMGAQSPAAPLHIRRADGPLDASILIEDASTTTANRTLLSLVNNGNARIALENTANGARFELGTNANNGNFIFIADGEPIFTLTPNGRVLFGVASNPTLDVFPNGNGSFRGTVTATDYLMSSDVNEKQDIEEMPGNLVLAKLEQLPVTEWSYKKTPAERHVGPMAQDFKKVFNLGSDETKINPADMAGVSLAAVKALKQEKDSQIELQQAEIKALKAENARKDAKLSELRAEFEQRFAALEARLIEE